MNIQNNRDFQIYGYGKLVDSVYYLIRGSEIMNAIDISGVSPMAFELVRSIQPLTKQLELHSKQLDYCLTQGANNE